MTLQTSASGLLKQQGGTRDGSTGKAVIYGSEHLRSSAIEVEHINQAAPFFLNSSITLWINSFASARLFMMIRTSITGFPGQRWLWQ